MKGLLIKDYRLLYTQKQFVLFMVVLSVIYSFALNSPAFVVSFVTMVLSGFTLSTISYDDMNGGSAFLFTLPITRTGYINEKYVFHLINTLTASTIFTVLQIIISGIRGNMLTVEEIVIIFLTGNVVAMILTCVNIPLHLKFGAEKSRIATIGSVIVAILLVSLANWIGKQIGIETTMIDSWLEQLNIFAGICVVLVFCGLLVMISRSISVKVMKKKEF